MLLPRARSVTDELSNCAREARINEKAGIQTTRKPVSGFIFIGVVVPRHLFDFEIDIFFRLTERSNLRMHS